MKYKIMLILTVSVFIVIELTNPEATDWRETLYSKDKIPYGTFALSQVLTDLFPNSEIEINNESLYQNFKRDSSEQNVLIIAKTFEPSKEDINSLISNIKQGSNLILFAEYVGMTLQDSLGIEMDYFFDEENILNPSDTSIIRLQKQNYDLPNAYLRSIVLTDSTVDVIGKIKSLNNPIIARKDFGKGKIIYCSIPMLLTNYYILSSDNYKLAEDIFNLVPNQKITWSEVYQLGRLESQTPLRYILSQPAMKWAYYITMVTLILFIIFRAKREQRAIPTINPPRNSSIDFAETVGQLYLNQGDHKDLLSKKIVYLKDYIYTHFYMHINFEPDEIDRLAHKSGKETEEIKRLFLTIKNIESASNINQDDLLKANKIIESFYVKSNE